MPSLTVAADCLLGESSLALEKAVKAQLTIDNPKYISEKIWLLDGEEPQIHIEILRIGSGGQNSHPILVHTDLLTYNCIRYASQYEREWSTIQTFTGKRRLRLTNLLHIGL